MRLWILSILIALGVGPRGVTENKPLLRAFTRFDGLVVKGRGAQAEMRESMKTENWLKNFRPVRHSLVQVIEAKGQAVAAVRGVRVCTIFRTGRNGLAETRCNARQVAILWSTICAV